MRSSSGKGFKRLKILNLVAYALIGAALLFSLYCLLGTNVSLSGGGHILASKRLILEHRYTEPSEAVKRIEPVAESPLVSAEKLGSSPCTMVSSVNNIRNPRLYHTVTTAAGFANHWQARVHYYWFKKQRELCMAEGICDIGGFTRLLHTGKSDDLMDEIPTVVVDPLPKSIMKNSSYIVLNRPYAFVEWLQRASIPEKYVLMAEADHLFLRPMPNIMNGESQGAALFSYMVPDKYGDIVRKFVGNVSDEEIKKVPRIGNSPTMISIKELRETAPMWYNTTMAIFNDEEAHSAWNWVLEMYGYSLATYRLGQHKNMRVSTEILAHPPFDTKEVDYKGDPFYILHLTYPMRYTAAGNLTDKDDEALWIFDKRAYGDKPPPLQLPDPPPVVHNDLARITIRMINEATASIPCWRVYATTKVVTTNC